MKTPDFEDRILLPDRVLSDVSRFIQVSSWIPVALSRKPLFFAPATGMLMMWLLP